MVRVEMPGVGGWVGIKSPFYLDISALLHPLTPGDPCLFLFFSSSFLFSLLVYIESIHSTSHLPYFLSNRRRSRLHVPECHSRPLPLPFLASFISIAPHLSQSYTLCHHHRDDAAHSSLPASLALPATSGSLLPQTIHRTRPQRGTWTLILPLHQFPLLFRGWFTVFTTLITWESSSLLFESSTSQPIDLAPNCRPKHGPRIRYMHHRFYSHSHTFAFSEIRNIVSSQNPQSVARRSSLSELMVSSGPWSPVSSPAGTRLPNAHSAPPYTRIFHSSHGRRRQ